MYSRDEIERVRSAIDIVELIREYVPSLNTSGRSVKGLCPFHGEKTPSFHVQRDKGFFKCFGCGEAGDAITFLSKIEQVGFSEALERLAQQAGIALARQSSPAERVEADSRRDKLWRILEVAKSFYMEQLGSEKTGASARSYIAERSLQDETVRNFELGFAPAGGESLVEKLVKKNYSIDLIIEAGLAVRSAAGRYYDPMFGRLVFPIHDSFGHVVGFGGRVLPEAKANIPGFSDLSEGNEGPKYLNSPESPVFSKGKILYGLPQAKPSILSMRKAIVLEGYMDVVGLHQGGVTNAIATLGTALTRDHAKLLKRYADEAIAFFDPDEAGRRAAIRGLEPLLQESVFPYVVWTDETVDPDELLLKHGLEWFSDLVKKAPDFVDYLIQVSGVDAATNLDKKSRAAGEILSIVAFSSNEILKSEWASRVASAFGVSANSLEKELGKKRTNATVSSNVTTSNRTGPRTGLPTVEEEYLRFLFTAGRNGLSDTVTPEDFRVERDRRLYEMMVRELSERGEVSLPTMVEATPEVDREWVTNLLMDVIEINETADERDRLTTGIRFKRDRDRFSALGQKLKQGTIDPQILQEYRELSKRVKGSVA